MRKSFKQKIFRIDGKFFASKSKLKKVWEKLSRKIVWREKRKKFDDKKFEIEKFENNWKNFEEKLLLPNLN